MARRDLRLNFAKLEGIALDINRYKGALDSIERALSSIQATIGSARGEAADKLRGRQASLMKDIQSQKAAAADLYKIFKDYSHGMQGVIRPKSKASMMRVSRNDIWFNIQQIRAVGTDHVASLRYFPCDEPAYFQKIEDDEKARRERNYAKLAGAERLARDLSKLKPHKEQLSDIYKSKIKAFEEKDNEFAGRAMALYSKYTGLLEGLLSGFGDSVDLLGDIVVGALAGALSMAAGIAGLAAGAVAFAAQGAVWACTAPFGAVPGWCRAYFDGVGQTIGTILDDPMLIVEGMGQEIFDTIEEKGIVYGVSYVVGDVVAGLGIAKALSIVGKASKGVNATKTISDAPKKKPKMTSAVDDVGKWKNPDGSIKWPPNNGAVQGTEEIITLRPGDKMGRYGGEGGKYSTQTGTKPEKLSLEPGANLSDYREYRIVKSIPGVEKSTVAPWFDQPGGGIQYRTPFSIRELIDRGYIVPIK